MADRDRLDRALDQLADTGDSLGGIAVAGDTPTERLASLLRIIEDTIMTRQYFLVLDGAALGPSLLAGNRRLFAVGMASGADASLDTINEAIAAGAFDDTAAGTLQAFLLAGLDTQGDLRLVPEPPKEALEPGNVGVTVEAIAKALGLPDLADEDRGVLPPDASEHLIAATPALEWRSADEAVPPEGVEEATRAATGGIGPQAEPVLVCLADALGQDCNLALVDGQDLIWTSADAENVRAAATAWRDILKGA